MKMKKIFAMLMLAGAVAVVATSCKKDDDDARDPYVGDYTSVAAEVKNVPVMGDLEFTNLTFKVEKDGDGFKLSGNIVNPDVMGGMPIPVSLHLSNLEYITSTVEGQSVSVCAYEVVDQPVTVAGTTLTFNGDGALGLRGGIKGLSIEIVSQMLGADIPGIVIEAATMIER